MNSDRLIIKRFEEMNELMKKVSLERRNQHGITEVLFQQWATSVLNLLQRVFGENSVHFEEFFRFARNGEGWFENCQGIFLSAKDDYENGYLFNLKSLVKAEVLIDDVMGQAKELLMAGYKDPACVLAGVALETSIKELSSLHNISFAKLDLMNANLSKAGVYNVAKQKQITAWTDLRNKAAHGQWKEYDKADVEDMISGVTRFIADYL